MIRFRMTDVVWTAAAAGALSAAGLTVRRMRASAAEPVSPVFERRTVANAVQYAAAGHLIGSPHAALRIVAFADFQCPFCRRMHATLDSALRRDSTSFAVLYRYLPLAIHDMALPAAIAAECAAAQSRFAEYARVSYARQPELRREMLIPFAVEAGVIDTARFRRCESDPATTRPVQMDLTAAANLGITGTPAFLIGDQLVEGAIPLDTLDVLIADARARVNRRSISAP